MELTYPPGNEVVLELQREIAECNPSELRAVRFMMSKLKEGRIGKPPLNLLTDRRNWRKEAVAEHADAVWYLFFQLVTMEDR